MACNIEGNVIYCKVVFQAILCFFESHSFPCQSLLLGTNIPNDILISLGTLVPNSRD